MKNTPDAARAERDDRLQAIEALILEEGSVAAKELASRFQVSLMTVYRDLDALNDRGVVRKVRGGATAHSSIILESDLRFRLGAFQAEKRAIAREAARFVDSGEAILLDDSSTVSMMAEFLDDLKPLTIISNSVALLEQLATAEDLNFVCLGGEYVPRYRAFGGLMTESQIERLRPHVAFVSASAVHEGIAYHPDQDIVRVKKAMVASAAMSVLLLDSSKFHGEALYKLFDLRDFHQVISDWGLDPEIERTLRDAGVPLIIAQRKAEKT
jgi:DeoR/GlpR family transcriptional regulator of sugar metabolism